MALTLKDLAGGVVGAVNGGRSQVTVTAAGAKVAQGLDKFRADMLAGAERLGRKVAPSLGGDFFEALAKGAAPAASAARAEEAGRLTGLAVDPRKAWDALKQSPKALAAGAAVLALGAYLVYRWTR